jgi:hypothetical protein
MQLTKGRLFGLILPPSILRPKRPLADVLCIAILITLCIAIGWPRFRNGLDLGDEGCLAYGALRVLEGQIPNRDFVTPQAPLSFYAVAATFEVLGTSLLSMRILGLAIFILIPLLIYGIGRCLMSKALALMAAIPGCILGLPFFNFAPLAMWQGVAASIAAVLLFAYAIMKKQMRWAIASGAAAALALFLRHDQAVYTSLALGVFVLAEGFGHGKDPQRHVMRTLAVPWLTGFALIIVPLIIFFSSVGAIPEMFRQLVVFPLTIYPKTSSVPFPKILWNAPLSENAWITLFYLPPVVQIVAACYLAYSIIRNDFTRRHRVLLFLTFWSGLFSIQTLTRSDLEHLLPTLPPFFLLVCFGWSLVFGFVKDRVPILGYILAISGAICTLACLVVLSGATLQAVVDSAEPLQLERAGGIRIPKASVLTDFVQRLQSRVPADHSILALPYEPMFYFLAKRRNPTRWNYLWPGDQTPADHARLIAEVERDPPDVVLLTIELRFATQAKAIVQYVHDHYDLNAGDETDLNIYVRRKYQGPASR